MGWQVFVDVAVHLLITALGGDLSRIGVGLISFWV
jgi:hypothetical protein